MSITTLPSLPQNDSLKIKNKRIFQLSLARTKYNYMTSYLEDVPLSADIPQGEEFSLKYKEGALLVFFRLAENFKTNIIELLEKELKGDVDTDIFKEIQKSYTTLEKEMSVFHPQKDIKNLKSFIHSLSKIPIAVEDALNLPKDLLKMITGIEAVIEEVKSEGPTALLKSTLYDLLNNNGKRNYLNAKNVQDYQDLYQSFETPPLTVSIKNKPWMKSGKEPYQQDWFFGYLQTAGFNTTNLLAIRTENTQSKSAILLSTLLQKMPLTDKILQSVLGDSNINLQNSGS